MFGLLSTITLKDKSNLSLKDRSWHEKNSEYKIYGHTSDYNTIKNTVPEIKDKPGEQSDYNTDEDYKLYTFHLNDTF